MKFQLETHDTIMGARSLFFQRKLVTDNDSHFVVEWRSLPHAFRGYGRSAASAVDDSRSTKGRVLSTNSGRTTSQNRSWLSGRSDNGQSASTGSKQCESSYGLGQLSRDAADVSRGGGIVRIVDASNPQIQPVYASRYGDSIRTGNLAKINGM